ncbi:bifunctional transcriptional activator/DNA repair enzyme AdaA [Oceanibacterium hippocampi]|uniref:methylated-DNA--[protein]-cysteine S-methyltransferase n=1 Tax=Oceanibacterium hippocampi TaxID=745714 RepID=A0A1Y5S922_9PROT|nr:methylated-DNA--[protein]-cysteine S-methyltransferase [Oceanibacterium hippocampi]SLN34950.1 Bifunctional transcriptional activator/DNA repair enzyme Ada [Oceanibacterium hippocampi]
MDQTDKRFDAFMNRDKSADGSFVVAVTSTHIYCRPSCPARRPKPENIRFYDLPEAAEQAGFRACKRCHPRDAAAQDPDVRRVRRACEVIAARLAGGEGGPPTLDELAEAVGTSASHLQRRFRKLVGVSPRDYADQLRLTGFKGRLRDGDDIAGALYESGYGSPSRVYERAGATMGMTPATYAKGGKGARMGYAIAASPLGRVLVAGTVTGVSAIYLGDDEAFLAAELRAEYPLAEIVRDEAALGPLVAVVLRYLEGDLPHPELPLDVQGTAFQRRVWQELMAIPAGETATYKDLAVRMGQPKAARAVGRACATNPVSLAIPCHRAIGTDGALHGYRWGLDRKQAILARERARRGKAVAAA